MSYVPNRPAAVPPQLRMLSEWALAELSALANELEERTRNQQFAVRYTEPDRPRAGMVVYADGTSWDPGSGEGVYVYNLAGVWVKL